MPELGVNIDHIATVREARRTNEPDPVWAAAFAELGGADSITIHLREDRRHIQERDVRILRETVTVKMNLEIACDDDVVRIACETRPSQATLVPERREELTTEGGLDAAGNPDRVRRAIDALQERGIPVSLFLDPEERQIEMARQLNVRAVELHTGAYAAATDERAQRDLLQVLAKAARQVVQSDLVLHAGHGLTYRNVCPVASLDQMHELNIGHSIVARAMMVGLQQAVREMKHLVRS